MERTPPIRPRIRWMIRRDLPTCLAIEESVFEFPWTEEDFVRALEIPLPGGRLLIGDVLDGLAALPDASVHCVATSPPYWALRDYKVPPTDWPAISYAPMAGLPALEIPAESCCLGMEKTPEAFVGHLLHVFRQVGRVLRDDGVVFCNLGDSYSASGMGGNPEESPFRKQATNVGSLIPGRKSPVGLLPKNLVGIPWRFALAMQADGWYLRSEIIWHKPSPMPESVTDRCTKAHEPIFQFAKKEGYFFDHVAIQEPVSGNAHARGKGTHPKALAGDHAQVGKANASFSAAVKDLVDQRNRRSVWRVSFEPYKEAHFAVFPTKLVEPMILAGSSAAGCCSECGAPHRRLTEKDRIATRPGNDSKVGRASAHEDSPHARHNGTIVGNRDPQRHTTVVRTTGWEPTCDCAAGVTPCTVLDPFMGSGTTAAVAFEHGRRWVGIDLNPDHANLVRKRLVKAQPRLLLEAEA